MKWNKTHLYNHTFIPSLHPNARIILPDFEKKTHHSKILSFDFPRAILSPLIQLHERKQSVLIILCTIIIITFYLHHQSLHIHTRLVSTPVIDHLFY